MQTALGNRAAYAVPGAGPTAEELSEALSETASERSALRRLSASGGAEHSRIVRQETQYAL